MNNITNTEKTIECCKKLKEVMTLNDSQLEFLSHLCYNNIGMWDGDTNSLIRKEAKREIFLFLKTIKECTAEETARHFINNGEQEWIISLMNLLTAQQ